MFEYGMSEAEEHYRAESDFHTLVRASEITDDEERVKAVKEFAKKQKKNFDKVLDKEYLKKIGIK